MPFFGGQVGGCHQNSTHLAHVWRAGTFRSDILKLFLLVQMIHDRDKAKKTKMRIQNEAKNEYNRVRRRSAEAKRAILRVSASLPAETEVKVSSQSHIFAATVFNFTVF